MEGLLQQLRRLAPAFSIFRYFSVTDSEDKKTGASGVIASEAPVVGKTVMECRVGCAACCIAPSISSPIPGMAGGKPAGERCVQLTADNRCRIFGFAERPTVCSHLKPSREMCGDNDREALERLAEWEELTRPAAIFCCRPDPSP